MTNKITKINKILLSITILISVVFFNKVEAFSATLNPIPSSIGQDIEYNATVSSSGSVGNKNTLKNYHQNNMTLNRSGKNQNAYCIDPGWTASYLKHKNFTCTTLNKSSLGLSEEAKEHIAKLFSIIDDAGEKENTVANLLAVRFMFYHHDAGYSGSDMGRALKAGVKQCLDKKKYWENGDSDGAYKCLKDKGIMKGKNAAGENRIKLAIKRYYKAFEHSSGFSNINDSTISDAEVTFKKKDGTEVTTKDKYQVTYIAKSSEKIDENAIQFRCNKNCEITRIGKVGSKTWEITIVAKIPTNTENPDCTYKIFADELVKTENNDGNCTANTIYVCTTGIVGYQKLIYMDCPIEDDEDTYERSGGKYGTLVDKVPENSEFYRYHCTNPNKCDEPTKIETPGICDDASDEQIKITGPSKQIKQCVLHGKDDAGNTYQDTKAVKTSNKYCSVYCKEDYEVNMPGAQFVDSGRYFKLKNTTVKATRTCYTAGKNNSSAIGINNFVSDIIDAQKEQIAAYDSYLKAVATMEAPVTSSATHGTGNNEESYTKQSVSYQGVEVGSCNSQTGVCNTRTVTHQTDSYHWGKDDEPDWDKMRNDAQSAMASAQGKKASAIDDIKACYNFTNELCLDTKIAFDYNETYKDKIDYSQLSKKVNNNSSVTYKRGTSIDDAYTTDISNAALETVNYLTCDSKGCTPSHKAENISTLATGYYYRKVVSDGTAEYNNKTEFQTNYPTGIVDKVENKDKLSYNYTYLGAVFPVALKTPQGVYNWTLKLTEIGQYNDSTTCKSGRLNDVAKKINSKLYSDLGYACIYRVDCPDCEQECVCPPNLPDGYTCVANADKTVCTITPPADCPDCEVECKNCVFDGKDNFKYKTISNNDIFPNERTTGANWSSDKGVATKDAIEKSGDEIYKEAQYEYKLDASAMKKIRDHNKETGTYAKHELKFHDQGGYKNINGTSDFLDEGDAKGFFKTIKRNTNWTLWTGEINNDGSGPSWK